MRNKRKIKYNEKVRYNKCQKFNKDKKREYSCMEIIKEIAKVTLADKINIIMTFLTFLSVVGVFITLHEMKVQRNAAYNPTIVMNPVEVSFEWDELGNETWLSKENEMVESASKINEDGSITGTIQIKIIGEVFTKYSVVNIGVGTAQNIVFKWDENNTQNLNDYLISKDSQKVDFCEIGEGSDVFTINNQLYVVNKERKTELMYMLPEAQEAYSLYFPIQYTLLINEAIKSGYMNENVNPVLVLNIAYYDIQENLRRDLIVIRIKRISYQVNEDGSGKASYQLVPAFPSEVAE